MDLRLKRKIDVGNLHHAYLIEGNHADVHVDLLAFLEASLGIAVQSNPDVSNEAHELFTIDHARSLRVRQSERGTAGARKIFIVGARFFTREAENALLKIIEEPAPDVHFFLITPNADALLPTLRSRVTIVGRETDAAVAHAERVRGEEFLRLTKAERLSFIATLIERYEDDDVHELLKGEALALLEAIERAVSVSFDREHVDTDHVHALRELLVCKSFMRDRGASIKMVLEYIALIFP